MNFKEMQELNKRFAVALNEAEVKKDPLSGYEVEMTIGSGGLNVRGRVDSLLKHKEVRFSAFFNSDRKSFKATLDNENNPEELAEISAEILKKHLQAAEEEIIHLLDNAGYSIK